PRRWRAPPARERVGRPGERAIEMAEIARIRPPGVDVVLHARNGDLVAAHCAQKAPGRLRHVAVVTRRSRRAGRVMRMRGDLLADGGVTLRAGAVAVLATRQLPVGIAVVHRVARHAGERAAREAARLDEAVVLAPRHPHHAVFPIAAQRERGVGGDLRAALARTEAGEAQDRLAVGERVAGAEAEALLEPAVGRAGDAVALATDLGTARRRKARRVHDG